MNQIQQNPNAAVAGVAGATTVLTVYIAGLLGLDVPAEAASAFTTLLAAGALFLGRAKKP